MKKFLYIVVFLSLVSLLYCKKHSKTDSDQKKTIHNESSGLTFDSSNKDLVLAFQWAKEKALSFVHDGNDPVGAWYEAALPNREAFCMRDVSHQVIGAELLGLGKHNLNMFLKFAENIDVKRDYCSFWEINRYNLPAPVDYENDDDFWYNLPANFDVVYNALRLYNWTGNQAYIKNEALQNFYALSMNEYVDHWDLGHTEVLKRNRYVHENKKAEKRFEGKRGIPTYNEGGRGETILGIDLTASLIAAYKAAATISRRNGDSVQAKIYSIQAKKEQEFLNDFWWDDEKKAFRSIRYEGGEFDYFMVGENQAFLHYLLYFNALSDSEKIEGIADAYAQNYNTLIVELKSYLPIIFYENQRTSIANQMIIDLCDVENARRDYPENSFTIIEHLTRGLMGIGVDAASQSFSTISRNENPKDWAEMKHVPLIANKVAIRHTGLTKSRATNLVGPSLKWRAQFLGNHEFLYVNGEKTKTEQIGEGDRTVSFCEVLLKPNNTMEVGTAK